MCLRAYEDEKDCSERVRKGKQLSLHKMPSHVYDFYLSVLQDLFAPQRVPVWPNATPPTLDISNYTVFEQATEIPSQTLLRLASSPTHASYVFSISRARYLMDDKSLQNPSILRHGIWRTKFTFSETWVAPRYGNITCIPLEEI